MWLISKGVCNNNFVDIKRMFGVRMSNTRTKTLKLIDTNHFCSTHKLTKKSIFTFLYYILNHNVDNEIKSHSEILDEHLIKTK